MKIYHGSDKIIKNPIYKGSNGTNDYGPAFYTTDDLHQAKIWACKNKELGIVNVYDFDITKYKVLDLTDSTKYSILNWVAVLLHYRNISETIRKTYKAVLDWLEDNFYIDIEKYDVVIGYRADDAYYKFPIAFISGSLSINRLEKIYKEGNLGLQTVLISHKAIEGVVFKQTIKPEIFYCDLYEKISTEAKHTFDSLISLPIDINEKNVFDLIREKK